MKIKEEKPQLATVIVKVCFKIVSLFNMINKRRNLANVDVVGEKY